MKTGMALSVVAAFLGACQISEAPVPSKALANEPAGARCHATSECATGLECLEDFCSVSCAADPAVCPAGTGCVLTGLCLPGCAVEADCQLGSTAGTCVGPPAASPSYCFFIACDSDAQCPSGSRCVEVSRARGITWNDTCTTGWCQR
jgi:hypothetical protein